MCIAIGYYSFEEWKEVHRYVSAQKLRVILESQDNPGRIAHFKFGYEVGVDRGYHGPLSANERIAYEIAEILDLPVMPVQFYRHLGLRGHLRWAVPHTSQNWSFLDHQARTQMVRFFNLPDVLVRMFVFDVFICNHDRHEGNVIYTLAPRTSKHDIYLIDHDLALYGTQRKWRRYSYGHPRWFSAGVFLRVEEVKSLISGYADLRPYVEQVRSIPLNRLYRIVDGIRELEDGVYLTMHEADVIKAILRLRQARLCDTMRAWCAENDKLLE